MAASRALEPALTQAFEPPRPPSHHNAKATASHFASSTSNGTDDPTSSIRFPPGQSRCLKCRPMLQQSRSAASISTNHPADSTSIITTADHVTIRQYIGPLPVPASAAKVIAKAIAEDGSLAAETRTRPLQVDQSQFFRPDADVHLTAAESEAPSPPKPSLNQRSHSQSWTDPFRLATPSDTQQNDQTGMTSSSCSPKKKNLRLAPLRPRVVHRDPSSTSVLSNASFVSAHSMARSALSDSEAAQRGQTTFGAPAAMTGSNHLSSSNSPSVSPDKKRFALHSKKSNQSFPVGTLTSASTRPPTSILKPAAWLAPHYQAEADCDAHTAAGRNIGNVRSADSLRVTALRQQRRADSEGSVLSPTPAPTSPQAGPNALPVLDLPLNEIEEAFDDAGLSEPTNGLRETLDPKGTASNGHHLVPYAEHRLISSSNGTTVSGTRDELRNRSSEPFLRSKTSFSGGSRSAAADSHLADAPKPQDAGLLFPTWEQDSSVRAADDDVAQHRFDLESSNPLTNAVSDSEMEAVQGSPTKSSRNIVGRGLPIKKRSLTFSREPSVAYIQRTSTGMHLSRAVDHQREFSRQSRVSRASTTGTFNTVGTVATDGSFGATAGTSASLARKLLAGGSFRRNPKRSATTPPRSQRLAMNLARTNSSRDPFAESSPSSTRTRRPTSPFAVTRRRKVRSTSYASLQRHPLQRISAAGTEISLADSAFSSHARGVQAGSVGTSGGGTKWVGGSFQIGERFWHILNARRDELQKSLTCTCGNAPGTDQETTLSSSKGSSASGQKRAEEHAAEVQHLKRSPDGVITLLAQEAQDVSDDRATAAQTSLLSGLSNKVDREQRKMPSDAITAQSDHDKVSKTATSRRRLMHEESAASLQTVQPHESTPVSIEARQGWSEIVSKMSSLTGEVTNGLNLGRSDRKSRAASPLSSATPKAEALNVEQDREHAANATRQDVSPRLPMDPDLKILARSSSLVESDKSSTASKSVYASLHPSTHANGFAPRASSLVSSQTPAMTRSDALSHPAPPASVEASNPQLVHQLLRRKSDLGERPDHLPDAASDHAVAIRPVASPLSLTPGPEYTSHTSGPLLEQDPLPFDTSPVDEKAASRPMSSGLLKAVGLSGNAGRKKTVKFDTGSVRPSLKGRFTASLFAGKAADAGTQPSQVLSASAGDAKPRPPGEVLARPQPHSLQSPTLGNSSPGSEVFGSEASIITHKSVLKKDRMLVKIAWTPHEDLPSAFDELQARKYMTREEEWHEYVVVFRMGKLELWSDPTLTNKLLGHGDRLNLRLTIPLSRGNTYVSLYSPIDRIFCLTFQPWKLLSAHHNRRGISLRRQGTDIVLFDCRAPSAAADWMWELWRELGGLIPESLEVHVPSFGLKVKLPVPETMPVERPDTLATPVSQLGSEKGGLLALSSIAQSQEGGEGFKLVNRSNVIAVIWKLFSRIEQWRDLIAESQKRGLRLELAWRRGTELDWVIHEKTVENEPRHWAVLCGALLRDYKQPSILELRAAAHYPTSVPVAPDQFMQEPPAVEGFLWRVKPVSGSLTRLYFTTYDGHIYVCRISRAFPPDRHLAVQMQEAMDMRVPRTSGATQGRAPKAATPATTSALSRALGRFMGANKSARRDEDVATLRQNVLEAISYPAETEEEFQGQIEAYQSFEKRRQFEQIRGSDGFIDLKLIHTIKTVGSGPVRCPGEDDLRRPKRANQNQLPEKVKEDLAVAQRGDEESDDEDARSHAVTDIGGQEGLDLAEDANDVRRARQIEMTLTNGKTIRLEAFSASVAREWVERIDALVKYWRRRERADAAELMYAGGVDITELHKRLQGHATHVHSLAGTDEQKLSPILGNIWNWCQIEGCRNIIRAGSLFHKKSSYSAFKNRDYVLIAGRLICFKLIRSVRTTRARQNNGIFHRRQDTVIHLRDAYIYSGKLSGDMLKNGRSDPAQAVSGIGGGGSNSGERHRVPRVYADGLFSVDDDEDCTFVIRYRPERVNVPADPSVASLHTKNGKASAQDAGGTKGKDKSEALDTAYNVPRLDDKTHKYIAMRARSKTERDLWVRCITYEIEKIVREDVEREKKLKNTGTTDYKPGKRS